MVAGGEGEVGLVEVVVYVVGGQEGGRVRGAEEGVGGGVAAVVEVRDGHFEETARGGGEAEVWDFGEEVFVGLGAVLGGGWCGLLVYGEMEAVFRLRDRETEVDALVRRDLGAVVDVEEEVE